MIKLKRNGQTKQISGINITPMVDVFLVLLIIFMVTASAMAKREAGFSIKLPKANNAAALPTGPAVVTLERGPKISVGNKEVTFDTLAQEISRYQPDETGKRLLVIKADESVPYYLVIKVMDYAGQAGIGETLLATKKIERKPTSPEPQLPPSP